MKSWLTAVLLALAVLAGCEPGSGPGSRDGGEAAGDRNAPRSVTAGDFPMQAQAVVPGVYAVITPARDFPNPENRGWNSNSAFVVTGAGVLVVDTGSSEAIGRALAEVIRGVTDQPVRWIVNTHGHGDHWLGNAALAGPDTEVIASGKVRKRQQTELEYWVDLFNRMTEGAIGKVRGRVADTVVEGRTRRRFGGVEVELLPSGDSHSPGDLVVWLPAAKVLITGDVVYSDRMPSVFESRLPRWIEFLAELEALAPAQVVPGHGRVAGVAALRRQRALFESLWSLVSAGYEDGQSDFEILPRVKAALAEYRPAYPGFDAEIGRTVSHVYLQVEQAAF